MPYPVAYALNYIYAPEPEVSPPEKVAANVPGITVGSGSEVPAQEQEQAQAQAQAFGAQQPAIPSGKTFLTPKEHEKINDLVALIVDTELLSDIGAYPGLTGSYPGLSAVNMRDRITRYASDVVNANKMMDVKILFFDKNKDTIQNLRAALENLYVNGDGTRPNKLAGIVLIGNIPIPVVNKKGNRFASIFPYTDFKDVVYAYNPDTKSFESKSSSTNPQAEIWHGVITAPFAGTSGKEELAKFFDKNHLYYIGNPDFANFDRKMFISDMIHEKENMSKDGYQYYLRYLESLEGFAYNRWNKYWANEMSQAVQAQAEAAGEKDSGGGDEEADVYTDRGTEMLEGQANSGTEKKDASSLMPDIQSRAIIKGATKQYYELFSNYISRLNDRIQYTSRYFSSKEVDTTPKLISIKDNYTMIYLKDVNTAFEKQVDLMADLMDQKIPLLEASVLSGSFKEGPTEYVNGEYPFVLSVGIGDTDIATVPRIAMRYPYYNEAMQKYYMNGIEYSSINNPQQCSVYLGSTKNIYFDDDLNFNPKREGVNGGYSILTRAITLTDIGTAAPVHTIGVNTRVIGNIEACKKTGGTFDIVEKKCNGSAITYGAVIEANAEYGTPAFLPNYLKNSSSDKYQNPWDGDLKEGDVIYQINGLPINALFTVEQAVETAYNAALFDLDSKTEDMKYVKPDLKIDFARGSDRDTVPKSFLLAKDNDNPVYLTNRYNSYSSDGAMFTLFGSGADGTNITFKPSKTRGVGFLDKGYDSYAGCVYQNGMLNSDKCFYKVASAPILDPAGATDIKKVGDELKFADSKYEYGSSADHVEVLQYPPKKFPDNSTGYSLDNVDEVILNSCYAGLPSISAGTADDLSDLNSKLANNQTNNWKNGGDLNRYPYPLSQGLDGFTDGNDAGDSSVNQSTPFNYEGGNFPVAPSDGIDNEMDYYGRLLDAIGRFVNYPTHYCPKFALNCGSGDVSENYAALLTLPTTYEDKDGNRPFIKNTLNDVEDMRASDIIINSVVDIMYDTNGDDTKEKVGETPLVVLDEFSNRYGMFDGVDNNEDGHTDPCKDPNVSLSSIADSEVVNYCEANYVYRVNTYDIGKISRKMFSKDATYFIPEKVLNQTNDDFTGLEGITLKVSVKKAKDIPSLIYHKEPTNYTLSKQMASMATESLPIDDPRYVAFLASDGIVQKITYPNLFKEESMDTLTVHLDQLASKIALMPDSYKVYGEDAQPGQHTVLDVKNKILDDYLLPVVGGDQDSPPNNYSSVDGSIGLTAANSKKVADALNWLQLGVDQKYEYILKNSLNKNLNSFVGDNTLTQSDMLAGETAPAGYEFALIEPEGKETLLDGSIVFEGQISFNKDLPEETDPLFNPLSNPGGGGGGSDGEGDDQQNEGGDGGDDSGDEGGVPIWEWLDKELYPFLESLQELGQFENSCEMEPPSDGDDEDESGGDESDGGEEGGEDAPAKPVSQLQISADKTDLPLKQNQTILITVKALDEEGKPITNVENNQVLLEIDQNGNSPENQVLYDYGSNINRDSFSKGVVTFKLKTVGKSDKNLGAAVITACSPECSEGVKSNKVTITVNKSTGLTAVSNLVVITKTYSELYGEEGPPTTPDAPTELKATPESEDKINLIWKDNSDNEIGFKVYEVFESEEEITSILIATLPENTTAQMIPGLKCDTKHYYQVFAYNDLGDSWPSNKTDAVTLACPLPPPEELETPQPEQPEEPAVTPEPEQPQPEEPIDQPGASGIIIPPQTEPTSTGGTVLPEPTPPPPPEESPFVKPALEKVGDITILVSDPVNETILYSTLIQETSGEIKKVEFNTWEDFYSSTAYYEKFIEPAVEAPEWEQGYFIENYYQKFLNEDTGSGSVSLKPRLIASLVSDYYIAATTSSGGDLVLPKSKNPFLYASQSEDSNFLVQENDEMVANGRSLMQVDANIYGADGKLARGVNHKVNFEIKSDFPNMAKFVDPMEYTAGKAFVQTNNGTATAYLRAGTLTGKIKILLYLDGAKDPYMEKEIILAPGDPYSVEIVPDSSLLVANGQSTTQITFVIKDKFKNIVDNSFDKISVFAEDQLATFDPKADQDSSIPGVQLQTEAGKAVVNLTAKEKTGQIKVIGVLTSYELENLFINMGSNSGTIDFTKYIGSSKIFDIVDKVDLKVSFTFAKNQSSLVVNESSGNKKVGSIMIQGGKNTNKTIADVQVQMFYKNKVAVEYSGPVKISILNTDLVKFIKSPPPGIKMSNGEYPSAGGKLQIKSQKTAGKAELFVEAPGFASNTFKVDVDAGKPASIELSSSENSLDSDGRIKVILKAKVMDKNGNVVEKGNMIPIKFRTTDATKDLIKFIGQTSKVPVKGVAQIEIKGNKHSGIANLVAEPNSEGDKKSVASGILALDVANTLTKQDFADMSPKSLYISVLGASFGNIIDSSNIAQVLLYSGYAEAVSSITASKTDKKRLFSMDSYGKPEAISEDVEMKATLASLAFPYQKIIFSDATNQVELGSAFVVPKPNSKLEVITDPNESLPDKEGIYLKKLTDAPETMEIVFENNQLLMRDEDQIKMRIDKFGRISFNDDTLELLIPVMEDGIFVNNLSFLINYKGTASMLVVFNQKFSKNVQALEFKNNNTSFAPGIYVKPSSESKKYALKPSFTRDSTREFKGVMMVDMENDILEEQAPGFSTTSLEDAADKATVGFGENNKYVLLFTAGNSVGESNLPYASDVGIVYGDPLIKLDLDKKDVSENTYFTKDVGKQIFSSQEKAKDILKFDFNGDKYDDLLLVYESGLARVIENVTSNKRFIDRGYIINFVGGILSMAKIDVNNDGFDDLIVGTKEPCLEGEQCINLYTNIGAGFERSTLSLAVAGKILDMKAEDMNADSCDDLVTSDTSGNVRVFYNKKENGKCVGLSRNYGYGKSFGFSMDPSKNSKGDLFIYYNGMEKLDEIYRTNENKFIKFNLQTPGKPPVTVQDSSLGAPQVSDTLNVGKYADSAQKMRTMIVNKPAIANKIIPPETYPKEYAFLHLTEDPKVGVSSSKVATDENGGAVELGDKITYKITLKNTGGNTIRNLMLSDVVFPSTKLDDASLKCLDNDCSDNLQWIDTGVQVRTKVISGISIPSNGKRTISYTLEITQMPTVRFEIGRDFIQYPSGNSDNYLDIRVRPQLNPTNEITYIYSTGLNSDGTVKYSTIKKGSEGNQAELLQKRFADLGLPDPFAMAKAASQLKSPMEDLFPTDPDAAAEKFKDDNAMQALLEKLLSMFDFSGEDDEGESAGKEASKKLEQDSGADAITEDPVLKAQLNKLKDSMNSDVDFDGLPDMLDPSLFYPGASDNPNAAPISLGKVGACVQDYMLNNKAYAGVDTDASDGSIGFGAEFDLGKTPVGQALNAASDAIENTMNLLRCSGAGCLPIPYNYAFFAPDMAIPGIAIIATGTPYPPFFQPMAINYIPSTFRFYILPTLTAGMVIAFCVGTFPFSFCWPIALPMGALTGCDKLLEAFLNAIISAVNEAMNDVSSATGGIISGGMSANGGADIGGESVDFFPPDSPFQAGVSFNIRIPGFPSIITDWIDKQTEEIYTKLLDFPDFYVIVPDLSGFAEGFKKVFDQKNPFGDWGSTDKKKVPKLRGIEDLARLINALPVIQIDPQDVTIKIPGISKTEIFEAIFAFQQWLAFYTPCGDASTLKQCPLFKDWVDAYTCSNEAGDKSICERITLDMSELIKSVEKLITDLNNLKKLPRQILEYKEILAKYAKQIVCYLDAILQLVLKLLIQVQDFVREWMAAIEKVILLLTTWKIIIDLILDFKVDCDRCANHRFSKLGLLLQLLVVIPSPPIIPLPKWPDVVIDLSKVTIGMKIGWPNLKFKLEPIHLPKLPPYFKLPLLLPELKFEIPGFILNFPSFVLPELPNLPPLPIPKLPDLPMPPEIPELPAIIFQLALCLKPIFKLICMIFQALIPIWEPMLETEAETMTQPNLNVVLALLMALQIPLPQITYDFVKEIRLTTEINISAGTDILYTTLKAIADMWNMTIEQLVAMLNESMSILDLQAMVDAWSQAFFDQLFAAIAAAMGLCISDEGGGETDMTLCEAQVKAESDKAMEDCQSHAASSSVGDVYCGQIIGNYLNQRGYTTIGEEYMQESEAKKLEFEAEKAQQQGSQGQTGSGAKIDFGTLYKGETPPQDTDTGSTLLKPDSGDVQKIIESYQPFNDIQSNWNDFNKKLTDYISTMKKQDVPDQYYVAATQSYLSPDSPILNRSIADLESDIANEDLSQFPELQRIAEFRNELLGYVKESEKTNTLLRSNIADYGEFTKILVEDDQSEELRRIASTNSPEYLLGLTDDPNGGMQKEIGDINGKMADLNKLIADLNIEQEKAGLGAKTSDVIGGSLVGDSLETKVTQTAEKGVSRLISYVNENEAFESSGSGGSAPSGGLKGLFVQVKGVEGVAAESVLRYTAELSDGSNMLFSDVDKDGDIDLIYTLGGDVYLKENYKKMPNTDKGVVLPLMKTSIDDYLAPGGERVQGLASGYQNNEKVDVSWDASKANPAGYEVILRKSLDAGYDEYSYRFITLTNLMESDQSIALLEKLGINPDEYVTKIATIDSATAITSELFGGEDESLDGTEQKSVLELTDPLAPSISVNIVNGNYFVTVSALNGEGEPSVISENALAAPQDCADKQPPFPITNGTEYKIPIFTSVVIDSGKSFDTDGKVVAYYLEALPYPKEKVKVGGGVGTITVKGPAVKEKRITKFKKYIWSDTNVMVDGNGDGIPSNDKDNPVFNVGPFMYEGDVGDHEFILHVVDQSGNSSNQKITISVFVPNISLNDTLSRTGIANGDTEPKTDTMPFSLMRQRYLYRVIDKKLTLIPEIAKVMTKAIGKLQKYYTNEVGHYEISDLNPNDMILVRNGKDEIVSEINPYTGDIDKFKTGHFTRVNEAIPPTKPTDIEIVDPSGQVLATEYVIANGNIDVQIHNDIVFDSPTVKTFKGGVHVLDLDLNDQYKFISFPDTDPYYPGGVTLADMTKNKYAIMIDTAGNIVVIDGVLRLRQKANNHEIDPLIIEVLVGASENNIGRVTGGKSIAEIYISALSGGEQTIIVGPNDVPSATPKSPSPSSVYSNVENKLYGADDEVNQIFADLYIKGLFDWLGNKLTLQAQDLVKRSEFTKVTLDMLCIIPRDPDAYLPYKPEEAGGGYSDIKYTENNLIWYYQYVKEGSLLGLVEGYTGKEDIDPITGLPPFKPENSITRTEAVKIILKALEMLGIIDLGIINNYSYLFDKFGWEWQYLEAAKDLTPYLKSGNTLKNSFIVTDDEAAEPSKKMTYEDLIIMANRVLDAYNCFEIDEDKDGMSDFCEKKYGVTDPNADNDNDGLINSLECSLGGDPKDKDSDGGGVLDGDEYDYGTDILDPVDDPIDIDKDMLTDGEENIIYHTDPNNPDTDGCGAKDGQEVLIDLTDPLFCDDDGKPVQKKDGEEGTYIVPAECNTCPCESTLTHKADIVPGDTFFSVISTFDETVILSKSGEVKVEQVDTLGTGSGSNVNITNQIP